MKPIEEIKKQLADFRFVERNIASCKKLPQLKGAKRLTQNYESIYGADGFLHHKLENQKDLISKLNTESNGKTFNNFKALAS